MRLNEKVKIVGERVILVPYEAKFVPKYHSWMQNEELQELTASMPLTLEQEFEMQQSWRNDEDKLTFLVMSKSQYDNQPDCKDREIAALVGDTNLFLHRNEIEEDVRNDDKKTKDLGELVAEAEIMIAESDARGKGYGWEAMLLMFEWAISKLQIKQLVVKIGIDNEKSLRMFKKMHFKEESISEIFKEVTLTCTPNDVWLKWLNEQVHPIYEEYINS